MHIGGNHYQRAVWGVRLSAPSGVKDNLKLFLIVFLFFVHFIDMGFAWEFIMRRLIGGWDRGPQRFVMFC